MARAGRKSSAGAKRRQTTRAGQGRTTADRGTPELRGIKARATKRADLPLEPLGVLYGHGKIDEAAYRAGQRLEQARRACFGADAAPAREAYGERLALGSASQWAARQLGGASSPESRKIEARIERDYDRLLQALHRCGPAVTAATLGIATRPYAGAWVAAALLDKGCWTPRHETRLSLIREGLAALDHVGSREL
jgi:hypothetical protein